MGTTPEPPMPPPRPGLWLSAAAVCPERREDGGVATAAAAAAAYRRTCKADIEMSARLCLCSFDLPQSGPCCRAESLVCKLPGVECSSTAQDFSVLWQVSI